MVRRRPHRSMVSAPISAPTGAPSAITREYPNDVAMLRPALAKNVGSQVMKP